MKYIASCSFGKDSLAMILTIIKHGLPLDEVVYCEVMFDETTSGEYPEHADFIHNKAIPILELVYGLKVRVLRDDRTYKGLCTSLRVKGKYVGTPLGFPMRLGPWCNNLKMRPIKAYNKEQTDEVHEYVGIAIDEPERLARLTPNKSSPLADYGINEEWKYAESIFYYPQYIRPKQEMAAGFATMPVLVSCVTSGKTTRNCGRGSEKSRLSHG